MVFFSGAASFFSLFTVCLVIGCDDVQPGVGVKPANQRCSANAVSMVNQRLRLWFTIEITRQLCQGRCDIGPALQMLRSASCSLNKICQNTEKIGVL